jgi:hypothetical protein
MLHLDHSFGWNWNLDTAIKDQKDVGSFEMCWRRLVRISSSNCVTNEEILHSRGSKEHPPCNKTKVG